MIPAPSGSHLKCLKNVLKLMGKHFIDPKSSEILSIFQGFPCTTQIALFWPKLLLALFLKKPWYPCSFEILEEALNAHGQIFEMFGGKPRVSMHFRLASF
jgi:hypothetical protein